MTKSAGGVDLSGVSTETLASELMTRSDLLDDKGRLGDGAFRLADTLGIRVCVDGAPARVGADGEVELMAIHRNTGPYAGRLCLIGGGIGRVYEDGEWKPESAEEALRRHFETDLGYKVEALEGWDTSHYLAQDMRPDAQGEVRDGFTLNPDSRHLVALRYLVRIIDGDQAPVFGATDVGGQEAIGIQWFTEQELPDLVADPGFGYGHEQTYQALFPIAQRILTPEQT